MTPSGIEPATFRFVAQYLNNCATISGPHALLTVHYQNDQITDDEMGAACVTYEGEQKLIFRVVVEKLGRKESTYQT
jgi:hypothetical protein